MRSEGFSLGIAVSVALVGVIAATTVRGEAPADLSPTLAPILAKHKMPGLVAAIVDGNAVTAIGAVGVRKIGSPEKMTPDDLIHLGSDTKAMTALLIGQLIEAKQLSFDTSMEQIFPDLAGRMHADARKITVAQLLAHTGGLPANAVDWGRYERSGESVPVQRHAAVRDFLAVAPAQAPGTKYLYSNAGYVLLGAILEQKTGLAWEELIEQKLFKPLKMTSAGFGAPGTAGKVDQPWGHEWQGKTLKPVQVDNPPVMGPAGRVHCTIADWGKFVSVFLQPRVDAPKLLDADVLKSLITPVAGANYAGGWISADHDWGGGAVLSHAGSNSTWFCVAWVAPKKDFAVLAATNVANDEASKGTDASSACDEATAAMIQFHKAAGSPAISR